MATLYEGPEGPEVHCYQLRLILRIPGTVQVGVDDYRDDTRWQTVDVDIDPKVHAFLRGGPKHSTPIIEGVEVLGLDSGEEE